MGKLYRKVVVSERMPPPMTDVLIKYRWNGYFEPYHYFDDLHCKDEMLNEVTHWIEEVPENKSLLKQNEEMKAMLEKIVLVTDNFNGSFQDFKERYNSEIKKLLNKTT